MSDKGSPFIIVGEPERAIDLLVQPGDVFEIRILEPKQRESRYNPKTLFGFFNDPVKAVHELVNLKLARAKGVYLTLNTVNPDLLARANNRFAEVKHGESTSDKDILHRRWLLVDVDPKRPSGISATDSEKAESHTLIETINSYLTEKGWPEPIVADSGNGYHLLFKISLPSDTDLIKRCLEALHKRFSNDKANVDTTVFNPARIVKLYGTWAMKGDHCPEIGRIYRWARLLKVPEPVVEVSPDLIESLAAQFNTTANSIPADHPHPDQSPPNKNPCSWDRDRMQNFIDTHLSECRPQPPEPYQGGWKWVLNVCPFNPDHSDRSAAIFIMSTGVLGFKCQHDGCKENHWKQVRDKFEPKSKKRHPPPKVMEQNNSPIDELVATHGPPIYYDEEGIPKDINQMYFAARYAQDNHVLYESTIGWFYEYHQETGLWQATTDPKLVYKIGFAFMRVLDENNARSLLKKRTNSLMTQILEFLKGRVGKSEAFRRDRSIIHVANGVLHLDSYPMTLNAFSPDYHSRNRSEITFDESADCPQFRAELLLPALSQDDISLIQLYAGQCLLGKNLIQRMLLLRGTPGGGKSTLVNVLENVIGTFNIAQLRIHLLTERFELAGFVGKTLLTGKDVPGNFLDHKAAYVLKALVGGDVQEAEQKNMKQKFKIPGDYNVIITSNTRLRVRLDSDSGAWRRRLLIVDYERPPTAKPIPEFDRFLVETEGPGILNWCITGAIRLLNEVSKIGRVNLTNTQMKRVDDLLSESDSIRSFVRERVIRTETSDVTGSELMIGYTAYCAENGWQAVTMRQFENQIGDVMMELFSAPRRHDISRNGKDQRGFAYFELIHGRVS